MNEVTAYYDSCKAYSRGGEFALSEEKIAPMLKPFTDDGLLVRDQLVSLADNDLLDTSDEELELIMNMDDAQLSELGFFINACAVAQDKYIKLEDADVATYKVADVVDCLMEATGITDVMAVVGFVGGSCTLGSHGIVTSTKELIKLANSKISAKVVMKMAGQFAVRYCGYAYLFWTMVQFADCMGTKGYMIASPTDVSASGVNWECFQDTTILYRESNVFQDEKIQ